MASTKIRLGKMKQISATDLRKVNGAWVFLEPFDIYKLLDSHDGLEISIISTRQPAVTGRLEFGSFHGYRNFDKDYLGREWNNIRRPESGVYIVNNSPLLSWAAGQIAQRSLSSNLQHIMIVSVNDVIDVVASNLPMFCADDSLRHN